MSAGILGTGVSGLAAAQHGLDTTGHNIANVNTEGYSRQRVETESRVGLAFRSTFLGSGTQLASITRSFNEYTYNEMIFNTSQYAYHESRYANASRLDNLLADTDTGLTTSFEELFDGVNGVTEEPTLISARNVVISRAENTAIRFNNLYEEVAVQHLGAINEEIETTVAEINSISQEIASLNGKIQVEAAVGDQGFPPNDLLDARDQLIKRLSELTAVDTIDLQDGTMNVTIGSGITLVTGTFALPLSVERNEFDSSQLDLTISTKSTTPTKSVITGQLSGGSLASLFETRDNVILPTIREIGKLATVVADNFNRQQSLGRDLNGNEGAPIFSDINEPQLVLSRTLNSNKNPTYSEFEVYVRNSSQLEATTYEMEYDGTDLIVRDDNRNIIQTFSAADIATMDSGTAIQLADTGLAIASDTNNMVAGETFLIDAMRSGATEIERIMEDPKTLAAADNYFEIGEVNNPNNVSLNLYEINDVTDPSYPSPANVPPLPDPGLQVVVDAGGTQYDIQDSTGTSLIGGFQDIPDDQLIEGPGFRFEIDGTLAGGEVFTIEHADNDTNDNKLFGAGDNTNMLVMLGFQDAKNMDKGLNSFTEGYADLITTIGVETKSREISRDSFGTLLSGVEERLAGIQGVNLDEEAASLIQYQQAYTAAARIISVARETFDTLLQAAR